MSLESDPQQLHRLRDGSDERPSFVYQTLRVDVSDAVALHHSQFDFSPLNILKFTADTSFMSKA